jgi:hypothetical protein
MDGLHVPNLTKTLTGYTAMKCQTCDAEAIRDNLCHDCYESRTVAAIEELLELAEEISDSNDYDRIMTAIDAIRGVEFQAEEQRQ